MKRFYNSEEVIEVAIWNSSKAAGFYEDGIKLGSLIITIKLIFNIWSFRKI